MDMSAVESQLGNLHQEQLKSVRAQAYLQGISAFTTRVQIILGFGVFNVLLGLVIYGSYLQVEVWLMGVLVNVLVAWLFFVRFEQLIKEPVLLPSSPPQLPIQTTRN